MKKPLFKIAYLTCGMLSAAFLVFASHPEVFAKDMAVKVAMGFKERDTRAPEKGLYLVSNVIDFRPEISDLENEGDSASIHVPAGREHKINDAEVLFFGDSFIKYFWGREFERLTGIPVYSYRIEDLDDNPLTVFENRGLASDSKARYLVVECAERGLAGMYNKGWRSPETGTERSGFNQWFRDNVQADEENVEFLLRRPLRTPMTCRGTLLFRVFRYISNKTPVYSLEPPMLFHEAEVNFNKNTATLKSAAEVADVVAAIGKDMKRRHGITVIFMPVPNKLSIYGRLAGVRYNGFLPELYKLLDKEGVVYIDLYHDFASSGEMLYHPMGTHWNYAGSDIAMGKLVDLYQRLERLRVQADTHGAAH